VQFIRQIKFKFTY